MYTVKMSFLMLQLSLLVVTVTSSSQFSRVIIEEPNSCARNDQVLTELKATVSQIQNDVAKLSGGGPQTGG